MTDGQGDPLRAEQRRNPTEKKTGGMMKGIVTAVVGLVIVGGGLGAAAWWFYDQGHPVQDESNLPILLPEPGPVKVRPDNPGGMEVPHRDTTIYGQLDDSEQDPSVSLQELPDMPKAPEMAETMPEDSDPASVEADDAAPTGLTPPPVPTPDAIPSMDGAGMAETAEPVKPEPAVPAEETAKPADPAPAPAVTASPAPSGNYRVQLASVKEEAGATSEWKRISSKNSDVLGNLQMSVQRTDLGDKGIFYRLQAGPLADATAAEKLCATLKERNVGCLIVRP
ncbi:SPOR domain-containing protein [Thalassospira sp.]|uniref:SPOR domain-containing protein n=1 Tax=Thalassospira sp. TaxID=1912094 RepID=UPI00273347AC|nr:SPOR domain-containing protein [Thalassospira sp.]MDP2697974.1 SPOR domain-containing protein [Thalassospira sp.]